MNLGSGAGFALEDVYVLTRSVAWAHDQGRSLREALELLDKVRGPHYKRLVHYIFSLKTQLAVSWILS
jgi:hypothetical protein